MQVEKPAVDKVWTLSTPLWPDKLADAAPLDRKNSQPKKILKKIMLRTESRTMNKCWPATDNIKEPREERITPVRSRRKAHQPGL